MSRRESLISRFPHFFQSQDTENLFYHLMGVFGSMMDEAEQDLIRVMQAHWVNTADNAGSQGFDANRKGDLDKIFTLYLESLGGTALLKQRGRPTEDDRIYQSELKVLLARLIRLEKARIRGQVQDPTLQPLTEAEVLYELQSLANSSAERQEKLQTLHDELGIKHLRKEALMGRLQQEADPDVFYRERIKGLIQVLMRGASTRAGIIDIVAANLGVVGTGAAAKAAKKLIRIEEYLPEILSTATYSLSVFEEFEVDNPNVIPIKPEVRLRVKDNFYTPLVKVKIVNLNSGAYFGYDGPLVAAPFSQETPPESDLLIFLNNDTALLNGGVVPFTGQIPMVPPGKSQWRFELEVDLEPGRFGREEVPGSHFDFALFDNDPLGTYPQAPLQSRGFPFDYPAIELEWKFQKLYPGSFRVIVPWDIPGYTEKFVDFVDDPRDKIKFIVDRVKAAGVLAVVTYEKRFFEQHEMKTQLKLVSTRQETHEMEADFDILSVQRPGPDVHEIGDQLILSGVFDRTTFGSLNTFA